MECLMAFTEVYERYHRPVHAYILSRTSDNDLALDLLQEVFMRIWRNFQAINGLPEDNMRYWIFNVAKNLLIDHYRRKGAAQSKSVISYESLVHLKSDEEMYDPEAAISNKATVERLNDAIARLPGDLRTALTMSIVGGATSKDIGEALNKPPGTVRYMLHRARQMLKETMGLDTCRQEVK